jgi:hypothetical protein
MGEVAIGSLAARCASYSLFIRLVKDFIRFIFACTVRQGPTWKPGRQIRGGPESPLLYSISDLQKGKPPWPKSESSLLTTISSASAP